MTKTLPDLRRHNRERSSVRVITAWIEVVDARGSHMPLFPLPFFVLFFAFK